MLMHILQGHDNLQDSICFNSTTGFLATFSNYPLLWVSNLQKDISLSTLHYEYVALSKFVRDSLPLKNLIKEVVDTL